MRACQIERRQSSGITLSPVVPWPALPSRGAPDGVARVEKGWVEAGPMGAGWACDESVDAGSVEIGCVEIGCVNTGCEEIGCEEIGCEEIGCEEIGCEDGGRMAGGRSVVGIGIGGVGDVVAIGGTVGSGGIVSDAIVLDVVVSACPSSAVVARVTLMVESRSDATAVSRLFDEAKPITMTSDPIDRTDETDHPSAGVTATRLSVSSPWSSVTTPASPTEKTRWLMVVESDDATLVDDPTSCVEPRALSTGPPGPASACALTSAATSPAARTPATERAVACRVLMRST
jgi:hypothetical protein